MLGFKILRNTLRKFTQCISYLQIIRITISECLDELIMKLISECNIRNILIRELDNVAVLHTLKVRLAVNL